MHDSLENSKLPKQKPQGTLFQGVLLYLSMFFDNS